MINKSPSAFPSKELTATTEWLNFVMFGHAAFQYLFSGCELGLFDYLHENPDATLPLIMERLELKAHPIRGLLFGLKSLGIVEGDTSSGYRNGPAVEAMLKSPDWEVFKEMARFQANIAYRGQTDLLKSLRSNSNVGLSRFDGEGRDLYHRLSETPGLQESFYTFMGAWSKMSVPKLLKSVDFSRVRKMLDVGGGDATIAIAIAKAYPDLHITLLDIPGNVSVPRERIRQAGLDRRIEVVELDFMNSPFPEGHDCIIFVHQLVIWTADQNTDLLKRAFSALPPGGQVVIFNSMSNDSEDGPVMSAMDSAYFLSIPVPGGLIYPWKDYETWVRAAGFSDIRRYPAPGWSPHGAVAASKV